MNKLFRKKHLEQILDDATAERGVSKKHFFETSVSRLLNGYKEGLFTCEEVVEYYYRRIAAYDSVVCSIISANPKAIMMARYLDAAGFNPKKPLWGIPLVVKDDINTKDYPTTLGSVCLMEMQPKEDAEVIRQLQDAGAIILGKTNLSEFACTGMGSSSLGGQTLNPYDLTHTPGGSSAGTGAALACNFAVAGLGTDAVNSVRSPASANALVGLRPTKGLVSVKGVYYTTHTQDTPGVIARTVEDAARVFETISLVPDKKISDLINHLTCLNDLKGIRIGLLTANIGNDPQVQKVIKNSTEVLCSLGAEVVYIDNFLKASYFLDKVNVVRFEQKAGIDAYLSNPVNGAPLHSLKECLNYGGIDIKSMKSMLAAEAIDNYESDPEYLRRLERITQQKESVLKLMETQHLDVFFYPMQTIPVVPVAEEEQKGRNGIMASCLGFPAITVPGGFTDPTETAPIGIPIGIEWMAKPFEEYLLLRIASAFEQAAGVRRPPTAFPDLS